MRTIVAGAPCSGKSSYVRENAQPGDLIYDYDTLHQALSGRASHHHLAEIRPYVLKARDAVFGELEIYKNQSAWIITSAHKTDELKQMSERFKAEIIFLEIDRETAHERARADGRPKEWHTYIDSWFDETDITSEIKSRRKVMRQKIFRAPIQLKQDGKEGEFTAEFATLEVIDHDGDITKPGAFQEGQETLIEPWNHNYSELPVGKGVIHEKDKKAIIEGQFFLDTESGMEHYKVVKNLGPLQEWSYTFEIKESSRGTVDGEVVNYLEKLDVWGVAPVTRGAGIDTGTTSIKSDKLPLSGDDTEDEAGVHIDHEQLEKLKEMLQNGEVDDAIMTVAIWIPATKKTLTDADQLRKLIDEELKDEFQI